MPIPTGEEIFESYLSNLECEIADDEAVDIPTSEELDDDFDSYLQETLNARYNDPLLESIRARAYAAYDRERVSALYSPPTP